MDNAIMQCAATARMFKPQKFPTRLEMLRELEEIEEQSETEQQLCFSRK